MIEDQPHDTPEKFRALIKKKMPELTVGFDLETLEFEVVDTTPLVLKALSGGALCAFTPKPTNVYTALYLEALRQNLVLVSDVWDGGKNLFFPKQNRAFFCGGSFQGEYHAHVYEIVPEPPKQEPYIAPELVGRDGV